MKREKYRVMFFDELDSTNDYVKGMREKKENLIAVAARQTQGRGTKGRSFASDFGGVYLSRLTFHRGLLAAEAFKIMAGAAVAVCKTLEHYKLAPKIKWVNDIHVHGKKICGILIENVFSGAYVESSVVGIGINVHNELPEELQDVATSVLETTGKKISAKAVAKRLIKEMTKNYGMDDYRSYLGYMGEYATILIGDKRVHGRLISVDDEGGLLVEIDGKTRRFAAAEVSVRMGDRA
ncbi:MAG: biotin--[acetyl-CoA-carboxylase] ligase [Clostridiales bacterium]|nr:biotin--[acetyl-CoA-carboxylase] ligase [Clostridiales bacterium]